MNTHKVSEIFIGGGAALDIATTNIAGITKQLGIVGKDMIVPSLSASTITLAPSLFIVNKLANGDLKRSFEIKGTSVSGYKGEKYRPAAREVWGLGYQRGYRTNQDVTGTYVAASGAITVNNSTQYDFTVRFKWDKQFYSERAETLRVSFTSSAAATQLSIATQITDAINNSAFGSQASGIKVIKAVTIGDGTGIYGLTAATNYGVEIWGLDVNQFSNTQYAFRQVRFSVHVLDASGFETTPCANIQKSYAGSGTYAQVYNMENYNFQYEGVLNRVKFPIPTLAYLASSTLTLSGTVAGATTLQTGNVTTVINEDLATVTSTSGLRPGEFITVNAVAYEIKHILSATKFSLTTVASVSYGAGAELKVKYGYTLFNILVDDVTTTPGANVGQFSKKAIMIATPAIDAGDNDPFLNTSSTADNTSAEGLNVKACLDAWMATTPLAPAAATIYL